MGNKGQIVGGELTDIIIREKSGSKLELGDLLVADNNEKNYTILQVKNIQYRSQASQSTHELLAGMELEGFGSDLEFFEPELRNYIIAGAKTLLYVQKEENNDKLITKSPKRLPNFFNSIRSICEDDLRFLEPENPENSLYLGKVRSGSQTIQVDVCIDALDSLTHHILIPATTGRGKSNLVKVMLWSLIDSEDAGILVLDPHNEYFGDDGRRGLRDHPHSEEMLEYYSPESGNHEATGLRINVKKLHPYHFSGVGGLSSAQTDAMHQVYNKYRNKWIIEVAKGIDLSILNDLGVKPDTAKVLRRRFERMLGIYSEDGENCYYRSKLFVGDDSGITTIDDISESLGNGKIVIIDSSGLSDYEELFVGSVIAGKIFNKYKNFRSNQLKKKPVISIVVEEAPRVLGKEALESQGGGNIYSTIAREGRKFKVGLIAITQLASVIPKTILANMNTKIILGNEMAMERSAIIDSASQDLSDDNRIIASLDKGEAIISSIFTRFAIPTQIPLFEEYVDEYIEKFPKKREITGKTRIMG